MTPIQADSVCGDVGACMHIVPVSRAPFSRLGEYQGNEAWGGGAGHWSAKVPLVLGAADLDIHHVVYRH